MNRLNNSLPIRPVPNGVIEIDPTAFPIGPQFHGGASRLVSCGCVDVGVKQPNVEICGYGMFLDAWAVAQTKKTYGVTH
jgi:hypothetical protein